MRQNRNLSAKERKFLRRERRGSVLRSHELNNGVSVWTGNLIGFFFRKFACAVELQAFKPWSCQIEAKVVSTETDDIANEDPFEQVLTLEEWYSSPSLTGVDR
jgi:hypothetical protein